MEQPSPTEEAIRRLRGLLDGNRTHADIELYLTDYETLAGDLLESAGLPREYRNAANRLAERPTPPPRRNGDEIYL